MISSRAGLTAFFVLVAGPVLAATVCEDLWFSRNAAFDASGYCFRSPLGQAVFDNSDCTSSTPRVARELVNHVARIRDREAALRCSVDTNRRSLDLPMLNQRLALGVQPVAGDAESLCIGYIGAPIPLREAPSAAARIIGNIEPGDSILETHEEKDGWRFASEVKRVGLDDTLLGWHEAPLELCEARAG
ncbi:MAG: DUF4453 domain-containing protein [Pseudomonadota bacterium]